MILKTFMNPTNLISNSMLIWKYILFTPHICQPDTIGYDVASWVSPDTEREWWIPSIVSIEAEVLYCPSRPFPSSSAGKESACNAGDSSLIPGSGRSPGEGTGYPRQYSWASLVAQMVKNPPAMWETWVWVLGWEEPWRRAWQPTPVFLSGESPWTEEPGRLQTMGLQRVGHD